MNNCSLLPAGAKWFDDSESFPILCRLLTAKPEKRHLHSSPPSSLTIHKNKDFNKTVLHTEEKAVTADDLMVVLYSYSCSIFPQPFIGKGVLKLAHTQNCQKSDFPSLDELKHSIQKQKNHQIQSESLMYTENYQTIHVFWTGGTSTKKKKNNTPTILNYL